MADEIVEKVPERRENSWRVVVIVITAVLALWVLLVQWLNNYTTFVLSDDSALRLECEKFVYEGAELHEVMRDLENRDYDVSVEGDELSASRLVPFNGPLYDTSVIVGVIMKFENRKATKFRIFHSGGAL
ncbi:hypothetical protein CCB81_04245 [Armatimonadetes bacterium Uphvl-Ar2]|nr:hypothetical protein CCB81_04245 [Armatimonadetes bacterium Uphvl-Ar2]